jgi:hypothetical protein
MTYIFKQTLLLRLDTFKERRVGKLEFVIFGGFKSAVGLGLIKYTFLRGLSTKVLPFRRVQRFANTFNINRNIA